MMAPALLTTLAASVVLAVVLSDYFATESNVANGQYVVSSNGNVRKIAKCPKCFFMIGSLPFGIGMPQTPGALDGRCGYWRDAIPESQYESCGEPMDGESNSCMYLNMTISIKNVVTDVLNNINNGINNAINVANNVTNVIGGVTNVVNNPTNIVNNPTGVISGIGGGGGGIFGRRKRQARIPLPAALAQTAGLNLGAVNNPQPDGSYMFKLYYKGCVKLSLLETLTGSNCRLDPDINDIRFFSQQALLQPLTDFVNNLNSGISGFAGINTKVDGLCYWVTKDLTRQIWKALLHYDPNMMPQFG